MYGLQTKHKNLRKKVLNFIKTGKIRVSDKIKSSNKGRSRQTDLLKRQKVEKVAITKTTKYYKKLGYAVSNIEKDNEGWDLEARTKHKLLRIEVKGLSQDNVNIELTPNEYDKMKKFKDTYRISVITNALRKSPRMQIFLYSPDTNGWEDEKGNVLEIEEKTSAVMKVK